MFNSSLLLYVEPESLHCVWNDLKNSFKRADFQPALLLGLTISQMSHGPFLSAGHQWTKQRTAEVIAETIDDTEFQSLRESMLKDRYGSMNEIPQTPQEIPELSNVRNLPIFVPWFQPNTNMIPPIMFYMFSHKCIFTGFPPNPSDLFDVPKPLVQLKCC